MHGNGDHRGKQLRAQSRGESFTGDSLSAPEPRQDSASSTTQASKSLEQHTNAFKPLIDRGESRHQLQRSSSSQFYHAPGLDNAQVSSMKPHLAVTTTSPSERLSSMATSNTTFLLPSPAPVITPEYDRIFFPTPVPMPEFEHHGHTRATYAPASTSSLPSSRGTPPYPSAPPSYRPQMDADYALWARQYRNNRDEAQRLPPPPPMFMSTEQQQMYGSGFPGQAYPFSQHSDPSAYHGPSEVLTYDDLAMLSSLSSPTTAHATISSTPEIALRHLSSPAHEPPQRLHGSAQHGGGGHWNPAKQRFEQTGAHDQKARHDAFMRNRPPPSFHGGSPPGGRQALPLNRVQESQAPRSMRPQSEEIDFELEGWSPLGTRVRLDDPSSGTLASQLDLRKTPGQRPRRRPSSPSRPKRIRPSSSIGEHRLKIQFDDFGSLGEIPQRFGKSNRLVPDGLRGRHEVYQEKWRFEVVHHKRGSGVLVEYTAENLASGFRITRRETPEEAEAREARGRTICNRVLRDALEGRAKELERELELARNDPTRVASLAEKIRALRPHRCLVGLLFFGLQHQGVQNRLAEELKARGLQGPPMLPDAAPQAGQSSGAFQANRDASKSDVDTDESFDEMDTD